MPKAVIREEVDNYLAITPAEKESVGSQLPGRENGPADAYRHLLWSGETTRRFGEETARGILEAHEIQGSSSILAGGDPQSVDAEAMDRHNNELGIAIGREANSWPEVIRGAQGVMDRSDRGGDGRDGGAVWLPESQWHKNPLNDQDGSPLARSDWNWPVTDWEHGQKSEPYSYPYDGTGQNHYGSGGQNPGYVPDGGSGDPGQKAADKMMASDAYRQSWHPDHRATREAVDLFYRERYGDGPSIDAVSGRAIDRKPRSGRDGGPVHVRAYLRDHGQVPVSEYDRSSPSR
jgi:hypothetical protein